MWIFWFLFSLADHQKKSFKHTIGDFISVWHGKTHFIDFLLRLSNSIVESLATSTQAAARNFCSFFISRWYFDGSRRTVKQRWIVLRLGQKIPTDQELGEAERSRSVLFLSRRPSNYLSFAQFTCALFNIETCGWREEGEIGEYVIRSNYNNEPISSSDPFPWQRKQNKIIFSATSGSISPWTCRRRVEEN